VVAARYRAKRDRLVGPEEPEEGSQLVERDRLPTSLISTSAE
jgi:hypothetical protein